MTTTEIKSESQKTLDNIPEDILQDILGYLKELEGKSSAHAKLGGNLREILTEDKDLLHRLAQ